MRIGVPKEIKTQEHRAGLVPSSVRELTNNGHDVYVQTGTGLGINFDDESYEKAGAKILQTAQEVFNLCDMIVKVKEPQPEECKMLREGQILFTYLHLAADPEQAQGLIDSKCVAIAYETVTGENAPGLPLLAPMSEVAGRLSIQVGAHHMQKHCGGSGRLISGVPGVRPARVAVFGGGVAGFNAARVAAGMGANLTIFEKSPERMRFLDNHFSGRAEIVYSNRDNTERILPITDLVIGAVLIPGASAPRVITRDMLGLMVPGTVMVDVAIDQGGCFETSRATTHNDPTFVVDDILHYCVANIPGAVPRTSAMALNNAVLPYAMKLADLGWQDAIKSVPGLKPGLNVCHGEITHQGVAESLNLQYVERPKALAA